jgi:hypothetical protein
MYKRAWTGQTGPIDPNRPIEHQLTPFKSKPGRLFFQTPLEALEIGDVNLAQPPTMARELAERATEQAIRSTGQTSGPVLAAETKRIMGEVLPSSTTYAPEKHPEMIQSAKDASNRYLFRDKPGTALQPVLDVRKKLPFLTLALPFVQTPAKITGVAIAHTPLGFATPGFWKARKAFHDAVAGFDAGKVKEDAVRAAQSHYAEVLAPRLVGTLITGGLLAAAKTGALTGAGPTDPKDKQALLATGWQPYSIAVSQKDGTKVYIPYNRFEPVAQIAGIAADILAMKDAKNANDAITQLTGAIASNFVDRMYMRGLMDFSTAMSNPQQYFGAYLSGLTRAVVPRNIVNLANALDPTIRDTKPLAAGILGAPERMLKGIAAEIPGVSTLLPERKTATGEIAERPGNAVSRLVSPIQVSSTKPGTELEGLLAQIGAAPGTPRNTMTINGRPVQLERGDVEFMQRADLAAAAELRRTIQSPNFQRLPDTKDEGGSRSKEAIIEGVYSKYRSRAREALLGQRDFRERARTQLGQMARL